MIDDAVDLTAAQANRPAGGDERGRLDDHMHASLYTPTAEQGQSDSDAPTVTRPNRTSREIRGTFLARAHRRWEEVWETF
ncbi:MAG: hypothetical protein ACREJ5_05410 [Geminicoccaceae bacterium]